MNKVYYICIILTYIHINISKSVSELMLNWLNMEWEQQRRDILWNKGGWEGCVLKTNYRLNMHPESKWLVQMKKRHLSLLSGLTRQLNWVGNYTNILTQQTHTLDWCPVHKPTRVLRADRTTSSLLDPRSLWISFTPSLRKICSAPASSRDNTTRFWAAWNGPKRGILQYLRAAMDLYEQIYSEK